jgi:hypothetical protein
VEGWAEVLAAVAEVPPIAVAAVVGMERAIVPPVAPRTGPSLSAADEKGLRRAAAVEQRKVAIDELAVRGDAHAAIVGAGRDSYRSRSVPFSPPGVLQPRRNLREPMMDR